MSSRIMLKILYITFALLFSQVNNCDSEYVLSTNVEKSWIKREFMNITTAEMRRSGEVVSDDKAYPFIVSLLNKEELMCSGILISPAHVLTTAKCVFGIPQEDVIIRLGSTTSFANGITRKVKGILLHPNYRNDTLSLDTSSDNVALIVIDAPVHLTDQVQPARLSQDAKEDVDRMITDKVICKSIGFGSTDLHKDDAGILLSVDMHLIPWSKCNRVYKNVSQQIKHQCVERVDGKKDICFSDYGGPLICGDEVLGIYANTGEQDKCSDKPDAFLTANLTMDYLESVDTTSLTVQNSKANVTNKVEKRQSSQLSFKPIITLCQSIRRPPGLKPCEMGYGVGCMVGMVQTKKANLQGRIGSGGGLGYRADPPAAAAGNSIQQSLFLALLNILISITMLYINFTP